MEKKKEQITMNALIEREAFLRRMDTPREKNNELEERSSKLDSYVFGDVEDLRSKV